MVEEGGGPTILPSFLPSFLHSFLPSFLITFPFIPSFSSFPFLSNFKIIFTSRPFSFNTLSRLCFQNQNPEKLLAQRASKVS